MSSVNQALVVKIPTAVLRTTEPYAHASTTTSETHSAGAVPNASGTLTAHLTRLAAKTDAQTHAHTMLVVKVLTATLDKTVLAASAHSSSSEILTQSAMLNVPLMMIAGLIKLVSNFNASIPVWELAVPMPSARSRITSPSVHAPKIILAILSKVADPLPKLISATLTPAEHKPSVPQELTEVENRDQCAPVPKPTLATHSCPASRASALPPANAVKMRPATPTNARTPAQLSLAPCAVRARTAVSRTTSLCVPAPAATRATPSRPATLLAAPGLALAFNKFPNPSSNSAPYYECNSSTVGINGLSLKTAPLNSNF